MASPNSRLSTAVRDRADALGREFASARPFRHLVIDDFFESGFARRLLEAFPAFDERRALNENGEVGGKATVENIAGIAPAYAEADALVRSPGFLALVSRLTGIPDLLYDPYYFGGGTHENREGQELDPHIDFNRHPVEPWHRRLNLIVYLNPRWEAGWGGELELHSDPYSDEDEVARVTPAFNRAVVFETTEWSWHGFSRIALPEDAKDLSRKSLALYFYTRERPPEELAPTHSTVYVDRPLPDWVREGHTLSADDAQALRVAATRRDHHIRRLYRDLSRQGEELEQARAALYAGRLGRLRHVARKLLAALRRR